MTAIPTLRTLRPNLTAPATDGVLSFLAPSIQCRHAAPIARFSTSPSPWKADNNKSRGVSAVRRTGPRKRQTLSVKDTANYESQRLPTPTKRVTKVEGDPDHGLWDFFRNKELLRTPAQEAAHGMPLLAGAVGRETNCRQGENGPSTSCATGTGRRSRSCGGCASRSGTAWRRRS
jgi:large subunit ribosomal protein L47